MKFVDGEEVLVTGSVYGIYPTVSCKAHVVTFSKDRNKYLLEFEEVIGGFYYPEGTTVGHGLFVEEGIISKIS